MTTTQSQKLTLKINITILSRSEVKKPASTDKQKVRFDQNLLENSIHQDDDATSEVSEDMKLEEDNESVLQPSTVKANQDRKGKELSQTRVSKTEKLQKLVQSKESKDIDFIRDMKNRNRFDVSRIFDLSLELTVEKLLNRSDITIKNLVFNMQRFTPRYRIKRFKVNVESEVSESEDVTVSMIFSVAILPSKVTARTYENDDLSKSLMISS